MTFKDFQSRWDEIDAGKPPSATRYSRFKNKHLRSKIS
jgi:hypothetical protein